jgi:hypothetical protein
MQLKEGAAPAMRSEPAHRQSAATDTVQTIGFDAAPVERGPLQAALSTHAVYCGSGALKGIRPTPPATLPDEIAAVGAATVRGDSRWSGRWLARV